MRERRGGSLEPVRLRYAWTGGDKKKSAGTRLADGMLAGVAEAYRSRTYHRRLSLPPVLKTGRHTGDDTPPHDRHICDTKPGGKQARPARAGVRQGAALRRCPGPRACGGHGGQGARARIVRPDCLSPERGRALSGPGRLRRGCRQGRQASRSPVPPSPPREHVAVRAHGRAFPCPSGPAHCQTGKETYLVFDP